MQNINSKTQGRIGSAVRLARAGFKILTLPLQIFITALCVAFVGCVLQQSEELMGEFPGWKEFLFSEGVVGFVESTINPFK